MVSSKFKIAKRISSLALLLLFTTLAFSQTETSQERDSIAPTLATQAEFPGGQVEFQKYILENLEYPKEAMDSGISGEAFIQFEIDTMGNVTNVQVVRINLTKEETVVLSTKRKRKTSTRTVEVESDNDYCLGTCAANLISNSPRWEPATIKGKKVRIRYRVPIRYVMF